MLRKDYVDRLSGRGAALAREIREYGDRLFDSGGKSAVVVRISAEGSSMSPAQIVLRLLECLEYAEQQGTVAQALEVLAESPDHPQWARREQVKQDLIRTCAKERLAEIKGI